MNKTNRITSIDPKGDILPTYANKIAEKEKTRWNTLKLNVMIIIVIYLNTKNNSNLTSKSAFVDNFVLFLRCQNLKKKTSYFQPTFNCTACIALSHWNQPFVMSLAHQWLSRAAYRKLSNLQRKWRNLSKTMYSAPFPPPIWPSTRASASTSRWSRCFVWRPACLGSGRNTAVTSGPAEGKQTAGRACCHWTGGSACALWNTTNGGSPQLWLLAHTLWSADELSHLPGVHWPGAMAGHWQEVIESGIKWHRNRHSLHICAYLWKSYWER